MNTAASKHIVSGEKMKDRIILHSDVNNFYASVAILLNPELKNKAVVIAGDPEKRHGIVLAKSELAKKAGIKTAETLWSARNKVKNLIVIPPDYKKYTEYSRRIFNIYTQYTPNVESFGLDECWLDVTGCMRDYSSGKEIADTIRERIKAETGLTVSIGVSYTKVFAKLGSDMKKPDATVIISRENTPELVYPLRVSEMLFVGANTEKALNAMGIFTIGELAECDKGSLIKAFGKHGERLHDSANAIEDGIVKQYDSSHIPESIGNGTTTPRDLCNIDDLTSLVYSLCEVISYRLRGYGLSAGVVAVNLRNTNLKSISRQVTLEHYTDNTSEIAQNAIKLIVANYDFDAMPPLRTVTVNTSNLLNSDAVVQESLFSFETPNKNEEIDKKIDVLRSKYGFNILKRGITINSDFVADAKEVEEDFIPFDKR